MLHPRELIDSISFARLELLLHSDTYISQFGFPLAYSWDLSQAENRAMMTMGRSFFPLFVGSGCPARCSYCGGNARTQNRINAGHRILWRSHDAVIRDIKSALAHGYRTMALCFDPPPESTKYYVELFDRMAKEVPEADMYFECWGLPEPEFIDAFARAFKAPHSYVALSPDTGNDALRRRHKGIFYTTEQLLETAGRLERSGVQMDVFFSVGFPGETAALALETRDLMRSMSQRFQNIRRLMVWAVQLEPGSPMFDEPEAYGLVTRRRKLADFIRAHGAHGDAYAVLGYKIPGFFGDKRDDGTVEEFEMHFQQFKCMELCFHSKDPRVYNEPALGRLACLEKRRILSARRGAAVPSEPVSEMHRYEDVAKAERPPTQRKEP